MTTAARIWNTAARPAAHAGEPDRLPQYENILGQIATGVFILEPTVLGDSSTLQVTFVNEMGATFFGHTASSVDQVLSDACN